MNWYQKSATAILKELEVNLQDGLSNINAKERLKTKGPNVLASTKKETILSIFLKQFKSPLIYILIFAAILVILLGQKTDSFVIIAVITINAVIGTIQEGRARNSLERLKSLTRHKALVRREGQEIMIESERVVPGDVLILREGDRVSADARIINAQSLKVDESILTGEAYSVEKTSNTINKENIVLGDQKNMLFSGTSILSGFCEAVVVSTGYESELGKVSKSLLETSHVPLPLAGKVGKLTKQIAITVLAISLFVLLVGLLRGIETTEILSSVIGLCVSIVPEGLPVAVTVILSRGVWRMAREKAIVRQMAAVEAMGNADTLMVDKTGTITTGKMVIRKVVSGECEFKVLGEGYDPKGSIEGGSKQNRDDLTKLLGLTYLSLKADIIKENGVWKPLGDSTEAAIAVLARKLALQKDKLSNTYTAEMSKPFDAQKRYIEAIFKKGKEKWNVFVGAPEFLSKDLKIDHQLIANYERLAREGLRVVGVAVYGPTQKTLFSSALLAIDEEIRKGVEKSVAEAQTAGFRVIMMTGDYYQTAKAIAQKAGIFRSGDKVLTGEEIERLTLEGLTKKIKRTSVFARITPFHKLKIVEAFKKMGHVVAMTGDGVNDAPALQAANLGIALGSGTQVAKDSSDIILVNDNFSTIISAISEGRNIYLILKKVILYLFSTSLGEVLVIGGSIFVGLPLPLVAVQIIWLNFVTDGFFVLALAQDPPESNLLIRSDVQNDNLLDKLMLSRILIMGITMLVVGLSFFYLFLDHSLTYARSMGLVVLSAIQWFNVLNVRSQSQSIFKMPLYNNWFLIAAFVIVTVLQLIALQTPVGNKLLHTTPLTLSDWLLAVLASSLIIPVEELRKLYVRHKAKGLQS